MTQEIEYRTTKVKQGREWVEIEFSKLSKGDKFRIWEPDGTIIRVANKYVFTAADAPYETTNARGEPTFGVACEE